MKQGLDLAAEFKGVLIVHQKMRGKSVELHRHEEHELFLPLQGEMSVNHSTSTLKAGPGKMIYLPPGVDHSFKSSATSQGERLIFMLDEKNWRSNGGGDFSGCVVSTSQLCKEILFHLLLHPKTKAAQSLIATLVQTISEMLESSKTQAFGDLAHLEGSAADPRLKTALSQIKSGFDIKLSIEELARSSGMSTRNLNRLFLNELGMTPKEVVTVYRIEKAKQLLLMRGKTVTDIALEVGYNSVSQFITTFRKMTGRLPSEYR